MSQKHRYPAVLALTARQSVESCKFFEESCFYREALSHELRGFGQKRAEKIVADEPFENCG